MRHTSTDYRHPPRPRPVAWLNGLGRAARRAARRAGLSSAPLDLDLESVQRAARRRCGLQAPPPFDPLLLHCLRRLVEAIEGEARLHPAGRLMVRENLVRILKNRLRFDAHWRAHPKIARIPLAPPVVVVGLQRTGTTLLHRLLAQDPATRWLASWEAVNIAPPPAAASVSNGHPGGDGHPGRLSRHLAQALSRAHPQAADLVEPRLRAALAAEWSLRILAPDFFAIHPVQARSPEEDCLLFDYSGLSTVFEATLRVPSFSAWLETRDKTPAYELLSRQLRYLAWQRRPPAAPPDGPVRWVLKTPQHLEDLDALLRVFPDARIVQTHRDPATVLASFSSMMAHGLGVFTDHVEPEAVADHWYRKAQRMVARSMALRDELGPWQQGRTFFDVRYPDLVADPVGVVRRLYAWMGRPLTDQTLAAMESWRARNPQHRYGRHVYRLADFDLHPSRVHEDFAAYRARFRIPAEPPS
jgi:hypothetical protein